jgi:Ser/Thr protein kinase RdoA (MazF antagonist)
MVNILDTLLVSPPEISIAEIKQIGFSEYGLSGDITHMGGERDRNFLIENILLKVANPSESDELLNMQCSALKHIEQTDASVPVPRLNLTADDKPWATVKLSSGESVRVRAFTFLPGEILTDYLEDSGLMKSLGRTTAKLDLALRSFLHPMAKHPIAWDTQNLDSFETLIQYIKDPDEKKLVQGTIKNFKEHIRPITNSLRSQSIHNDITYHNSVVDPNYPTIVTGIFDFGDIVHAPLIQNLAVMATEVSMKCKDPISRSAELVAAYHEINPLEDRELKILPFYMASRVALCMLLESWAEGKIAWTDDREFMTGWHNMCMSYLKRLSELSSGELENTFRAACGLPLIPQEKMPYSQ